MKFRKKPIVIEAERFHYSEPLPFRDRGPFVCFDSDVDRFYVTTAHEQRVYLANGDWIIPEACPIPFTAYSVKPDIFEATYEAVE
jgi:hypothetical protein